MCPNCQERCAELLLSTPVEVIFDFEGNTKSVIQRFNLPSCLKCAWLFGFGSKSYQWVEEEVLNHVFLDGRKRILDLILMPYFANVKQVIESSAIKRVNYWLKINGYSERDYKKRLTYQFRYARRRSLLPLSWHRFSKELLKFRKDGETYE